MSVKPDGKIVFVLFFVKTFVGKPKPAFIGEEIDKFTIDNMRMIIEAKSQCLDDR